MKKYFVIIVLLFLAGLSKVLSQNFIGLQKDKIISLMKETHPDYKLNKEVINNTYNYLKFENQITEQTMLFFLSPENKCTLLRWISDYSNINEMISYLDENYSKSGQDMWSYVDNNSAYIVTLKEDEWFFTVSFKLKPDNKIK